MSSALLQIVAVLAVTLAGSLVYFVGSSYLLDRFASARVQALFRPWLFLGPALLLMGGYLFYPFLETLRLSFHDSAGADFVGWRNYQWVFADSDFQVAVRNNILWLAVVPAVATAIGLAVAALAERVWWGALAKAMIFMPMAISFIGASVIWKFMYDVRSLDAQQIGLLNAVATGLGFAPQAWITLPFWNNFFLMAILIWIQTGFAMVIFSAALRGVPVDTLEAARLDGAGNLQIFFQITLPQIASTVWVVWTTITITVLKVFDIVMAMTGGQWNTGVMANLMYDWMFRGGGDAGRASTLAMLLMLAVLPVMAFNIRRFRAEEGAR
jgi:alpha-glucoside transport system permease protein